MINFMFWVLSLNLNVGWDLDLEFIDSGMCEGERSSIE